MPKKELNKKSKIDKKTSIKKSRSKKTEEVFAKIKVVGIGGGGGNIVSRMNRNSMKGVDFIVINTDIQDLKNTGIREKINIGKNISKGLGAGMNPEIGKQSAEEARIQIEESLRGADMIFLTAGMGGGTGTGAMPVVAEIAKELGILTVAVVTKPFSFEGSLRTRIAEEGLSKLKDKVDVYLVVPNDRIFNVIDKDTPLQDAFRAVDDVLAQAVKGLAELINTPGIINTDFADIEAVLQNAGMAIIGIGQSSGEDRALKAVKLAIESPLFEISPNGARGILFSVVGNDLKMSEINEAAKMVHEMVDTDAKIIFGAIEDNKMKKSDIKIIVIAAGFNNSGRNTERQQSFFEEEKREIFQKIEKEEIEEDKENDEDDSLDIPAFLRRKK